MFEDPLTLGNFDSFSALRGKIAEFRGGFFCPDKSYVFDVTINVPT